MKLIYTKLYKVIYYYYKLINKIIFKLQNIKIDSFSGMGFLQINNKGICKIGKNFKFNSGIKYNPIGSDTILRLIITKNAILSIGNNVGISNSTIFVNLEVEIGNNVLIGGGCKIWDSDFHSIDHNIRTRKDDQVVMKKIKIDDNVWIGGCSIILKGVNIGKNSVIGAGSVVSKSIPANQIWAGNPAKFIRNIENND